MTKSVIVRYVLTVLVASALLSPSFAAELTIKDAPQWVNTGTAYETIQGKRLFHGVGSAPVMGDDALQKATAEGRARKELQRILTTYLIDMASQYKTTAPSDTASTPEYQSTGQLTALGKPAIKEAKIVARWRDRRTGLLYTLIQLDLKDVKRIAANSNDISPDTQTFVQEYGDIVFDSESQYVEY